MSGSKPVAEGAWRAAALPASGPGLHLNLPWLDPGSWSAQGRDGTGRRFQAGATLVPGQSGLSVPLPDGFSGALDLADRRQAPLGRLLLSNVGRSDFQARSRELDVQVIAGRELLLERAVHPVRCFLSLPLALQAVSLVCKDTRTGESRSLALPRAGDAASSRGTSLDLPARFRGHIEARDALGRPVLLVQVHQLGAHPEVHAQVQHPGHEALVRGNARMLDISVQPVRGRTRIR